MVVATLADDGRLPVRSGVTHRSARLPPAELKISFATVARIWRPGRIGGRESIPPVGSVVDFRLTGGSIGRISI
ncbi:hypothetical protein GCM10010464_79980 [Pseudonocardia yunnanensis]